MAVDKRYCMSSYMAFRYIEDDNKDFYEGMHHENIAPVPLEKRALCYTADDVERELAKQFEQLKSKNKKMGIMLSGGMDSAVLASYMENCEAYTFRFLGGEYQKEELERAEYYAKYYGLNLHYIDISWETVEKYIDIILRAKAAPVHSIEPQILQGAYQAKEDGIELMVLGESCDSIFGGLDGLLSQDWKLEEFMYRYMFTNPSDVLEEPVDMQYLFERYRQGEFIDFQKFIDDIFAIESASSYLNAYNIAELEYYTPYSYLKVGGGLDLDRIRNGESKYLIRELMKKKYPEIQVPEKIPMPRPVDSYFAEWEGPKRLEFKKNLDMSKFTGNQKWQMWCLERFLNLYE